MKKLDLPENLTFEVALEELEIITRRLEEGRDSLEESIKIYEKGVLLKKFCEKKLKEAENKWLILKKNQKGEVVAEEISNKKIPDPNELSSKELPF